MNGTNDTSFTSEITGNIMKPIRIFIESDRGAIAMDWCALDFLKSAENPDKNSPNEMAIAV